VSGLGFDLLATDGPARRGRLTTAFGTVETPAFMPVGTAATVKAVTFDMVRQTGAEIVLCNTYHLMLRPGAERVGRLGGLHPFMRWDGPVLTDSGGYQVMSLAARRQLSERGVVFSSHIDGSRHELTPERSVEIQRLLDATITMQLDECLKLPAAATRSSGRWSSPCAGPTAARPPSPRATATACSASSRAAPTRTSAPARPPACAHRLRRLRGGRPRRRRAPGRDVRRARRDLPRPAGRPPRYLMGVGKPADIVGAVLRGIDMFDCVMPTRSGRTGQAFTRRGPVNLRNARHADDPRPLDEESDCPAARDYSRAYLHHLVRADEILGSVLLTWNNLWYYQDLMRGLRAAIEAGGLAGLRGALRGGAGAGRLAAPLLTRRPPRR
jgi:queuine tRNA-ribosyltransferase